MEFTDALRNVTSALEQTFSPETFLRKKQLAQQQQEQALRNQIGLLEMNNQLNGPQAQEAQLRLQGMKDSQAASGMTLDQTKLTQPPQQDGGLPAQPQQPTQITPATIEAGLKQQYPDATPQQLRIATSNAWGQYQEQHKAQEAEMTPFMKERAALTALEASGKGNSPEAKDIKAHLAKMDAPPKTNINLGGPSAPLGDPSLTGEDYMKTLPPDKARLVKALDEGRLAISSYTLRSPQWQPIVEAATQYDPNFDMSKYSSRQSVRRDFASGATSKNITAINTAIGHLGTMNDLTDALGNNDVKGMNRLFNIISTETGNPQVNNFELAKNAVSDELMRVFRQVGASDAEAERWGKTFQSANSPQQLKQAEGVAVSLLQSRLNALNDTWKRGMSTDKGFPDIISPHSKETLKKMGFSMGEEPKQADAGKVMSLDDYLKSKGH